MEEKKVMGPYELIEEIGSGGMSIVYKANHPTLSKVVAVKVLSPSLSLGPKFIERFKNEANLLTSFRHQNIVNIIDFGEDQQQYYIVMDFIDGYTVRQMIKETGPISLKIAINVIKNVASAISYTHRKGIIHRDLKSSNIMIDHTGRILVTDFGLSKDISLKSIPEASIQSSDIAGTFGYIAPEQLDPKIGNIDERTDIYSLGVVFYEMLTGQLPFSESNAPINLAYMHLTVAPESPLKLRKDLLPKTDQIVMKMLEKDPIKRYQSFEEVLEAVSELEEVSKYYKEGSSDMQGSFFEIVTEEQSFTKSVEEFNKTFEKKPKKEEKYKEFPLEGKIIQKRYRIEKLLLKRILSNLYLGYDMQTQKQVTVQIPSETRPTFKSRLEREIETMKQVDHPSFVKFLDIIDEDGTFYVIREFIEGRSIKKWLEVESFSVEKAVQIIISVLDGIKFLHGRGIVHRDINSDVVMITEDFKAIITTLGITRVEDASSVSSGEFLGVVQYTAPEQITQSRSDARSDIYSAGILLFELLTGKPPFSSSLPVDVMDMHLKKIPRFPDQMQNQIPLNLQRIVLKSLSKSPDQRYQSAKEFQNELNDFMTKHMSIEELSKDPVKAGKEVSEKGADPSEMLYKNMMEASPKASKNLSFSIKKKDASKDGKKKQKVNINEMITENIQTQKEPKEVDFDLGKKSKPQQKSKLLIPLLILLLLALSVLFFYPYLSSAWSSMWSRDQSSASPPSTVTRDPAKSMITLSKDQALVFPSFELFEVVFDLDKAVHSVEVDQLPQEVNIISSKVENSQFKAVFYAETVAPMAPFVARLKGLNKDREELYQENFIFTVSNESMIKIKFSLGNSSYQKITHQDITYEDFDILPLIHRFNIYLPLRFIVETFEGEIEYDFADHRITIHNLGEETYHFYLYTDQYFVGEQRYAVNPILEIEDRAYLPLFIFAEKKGLYTTISPGEDGSTIITVSKVR